MAILNKLQTLILLPLLASVSVTAVADYPADALTDFCSVDENNPTALNSPCEIGSYAPEWGGQAASFFASSSGDDRVTCSVTNWSPFPITYYLSYYVNDPYAHYSQTLLVPSGETLDFKTIAIKWQVTPWINIFTEEFRMPYIWPSAEITCNG